VTAEVGKVLRAVAGLPQDGACDIFHKPETPGSGST
jgi:hypothetical protein